MLKNQLLDLYVGIVMDVKKSTIRPICEYYNGCKTNQQLFTKPICEYYNGCKTNQQLFMRPICEYYNGCKKLVVIYET